MREDITGKRIVHEMKGIARDTLKAYNESCVTVGVRLERGDLNQGRAVTGGVRHCYYGISGRRGFQELKAALQRDGVLPEANQQASTELNTLLDLFCDTIVKYKSSTEGERVQQREYWAVHNCAESRLALYLMKHGIQLRHITIASYGTDHQFKAPCSHCAQWVQQNFQLLPDYKTFLS